MPRGLRAALLAALVFVAACVPQPSETLNSAPENSSPAPPAEHATATAVESAENGASGSDAGLPLDALLAVAWEDQRTLILAEQTLIAECMRSQGWPYEIPQIPVAAPSGPPNRRYGATEQDLEESVSSGEQGVTGSAPRESSEGALPKGLDPAQVDEWERALQGQGYVSVADGTVEIPAGGCIAEAQDSLYGNRIQQNETFYRIQRWIKEAFHASRADPEVGAVLERWRSCMEAAGWTGYEDPLALAPAFAANGVYDPRIRADIECKRETGLVEVWARVESGYQERFLADHETEILAWVEQRDNALERARQVLAGGR